jgi:tRNA pseudouridine38-40 synthase
VAPDWPTLKRKHRPRLRRVAVELAYDGAPFAGFQRQPERRTVEGDLVAALVALELTGGLGFASRTDAGVHARGQVVAFKVPEATELPVLAGDLSTRLPPEIRLSRLAWAPAGFHPRWSATGKEYVYRIAPTACSGVDREALRRGMEELRTSPSLSGFTAAGADKTVGPPLTSLVEEIDPDGALLLRFQGPAFRRYAIRHMVGTLLGQARGELAPGSCARVALAPPPYRGPRAAAEGLTLVRVDYPAALDPFATSTTSPPETSR